MADTPTAQDLVEFVLDNMRSQNLKMDGLSTWYIPSNLFFGSRAKTPHEALLLAYKAWKEKTSG